MGWRWADTVHNWFMGFFGLMGYVCVIILCCWLKERLRTLRATCHICPLRRRVCIWSWCVSGYGLHPSKGSPESYSNLRSQLRWHQAIWTNRHSKAFWSLCPSILRSFLSLFSLSHHWLSFLAGHGMPVTPSRSGTLGVKWTWNKGTMQPPFMNFKLVCVYRVHFGTYVQKTGCVWQTMAMGKIDIMVSKDPWGRTVLCWSVSQTSNILL